MMLDFYRNGTVRRSVIERTGEAPEGEEVYSKLLRDPKAAGAGRGGADAG